MGKKSGRGVRKRAELPQRADEFSLAGGSSRSRPDSSGDRTAPGSVIPGADRTEPSPDSSSHAQKPIRSKLQPQHTAPAEVSLEGESCPGLEHSQVAYTSSVDHVSPSMAAKQPQHLSSAADTTEGADDFIAQMEAFLSDCERRSVTAATEVSSQQSVTTQTEISQSIASKFDLEASALSLIKQGGIHAVLLASSIIHQASYTIQKFFQHHVAVKLSSFKSKTLLLVMQHRNTFDDTANWEKWASVFNPGDYYDSKGPICPTDDQRRLAYMDILECAYGITPPSGKSVGYRLRHLKLQLHQTMQGNNGNAPSWTHSPGVGHWERSKAYYSSSNFRILYRWQFTPRDSAALSPRTPIIPRRPSASTSAQRFAFPAMSAAFSGSETYSLADDHSHTSSPTVAISPGISFMRSTPLTRAVFSAAEHESHEHEFLATWRDSSPALASGLRPDHAKYTRDNHHDEHERPAYPEEHHDDDPYIVNVQRTLVRGDDGSKYVAAEQTSSIRTSVAHAFEQPQPYDSAPLVAALATDDDTTDHHSHTSDNELYSHHDTGPGSDHGEAHLTTADY